ncbi:MAG: GTPase [Nostoc sp. EfeVER01]|uniref:GTPase n=1 Tax=unclassified Nostoc TaxID=2593658 RepID=UPI002AD2C041|nr:MULTISPECIES: GTPase [unclassified Nostoc]MDZ7948425.1 GTPase [Nostoc sp. EfeVER01]MDZ7995774.1 GTPase [Nostoc sp. EspVER01]
MDIENFLPNFREWKKQIEDKLQGQNQDNQNHNDLAKCNILLIGKTGVGKSTLINTIFRTSLAPEGAGKPMTGKLTKYEQTGCPIIAFDSRGLELTNDLPNENSIHSNQEDVRNLIQGNHVEFPSVIIDVIYYCISSGSDRFEDIEENWITSLIQYKIPIIIVITKTAKKPEFSNLFKAIKDRTTIKNNELKSLVHCITEEKEIIIDRKDIVPVIPILALEEKISDDYTFPPQNLDLLVRQTACLLEKQAKQTFISEQVASIDLKIQEAQKLTAVYTSVASILALNPVIPISGTILPPTQLLMLKRISSIFGLKQEEQELLLSPEFQQFAGAILTTGASTILTSLIPVVGSINDALVAGTSTSLLCLAWIDTLKRHSLRLVDEKTLTEEEIRIFIKIFEEEYKKYCINTNCP